ncbi:MAG: hypothetical protein KDD52_03960 [Bdellovibrionales bacterium]|nr:hypothetical protein [Bdellovibrionales bacterium]
MNRYRVVFLFLVFLLIGNVGISLSANAQSSNILTFESPIDPFWAYVKLFDPSTYFIKSNKYYNSGGDATETCKQAQYEEYEKALDLLSSKEKKVWNRWVGSIDKSNMECAFKIENNIENSYLSFFVSRFTRWKMYQKHQFFVVFNARTFAEEKIHSFWGRYSTSRDYKYGFEIIPADKIASYMMSSASALERVENQIQSIHEGKYVDSIDDRIDELRLLNMFFSYAFQKEHPQKRLSDHQISVNYNSSSENFCRFNNFSIVACLGFQKFIDKWKENILDEVNFYHIVQAAQMLQSRVETLDDFGLYTRDPGLIQKAQEEHQQLIRTLELITSLNE